VEVYSVDGSFLDLDIFPQNELEAVAKQIRETTEQWTGIKVSVGVARPSAGQIGPTVFLKREQNKRQIAYGVDTDDKIIEALQELPLTISGSWLPICTKN